MPETANCKATSKALRAETGAIKFGDDWTGVFIRGDNAATYALALSLVLADKPSGIETRPFAGSCGSYPAATSATVAKLQLMKRFSNGGMSGRVLR
jgi:hypothetical protein